MLTISTQFYLILAMSVMAFLMSDRFGDDKFTNEEK